MKKNSAKIEDGLKTFFEGRWPIVLVFLLGILLRLFLSIQIYSGDVNNHIAWGKDAIGFGFAGIYERDFASYGVMTPTYPPIPIFFFTAFYWLFETLYRFSWNLNLNFGFFPSNLIFFLEDQDTLPAFLKIPAIVADIGIAYMFFLIAKKLIKEKSNFWPTIAASLVLFNPAFFYNSAYWGQIESVPLLFLLLAFYFLFFSKRYLLPAFFISLMVVTKQTSLVFLPLFAIFYWFKHGLKKSLSGALVFFLSFFIFFLPFFQKGNFFTFPFTTYLVKIQTGSGSTFVTAHAFNFWSLVSGLGKIPDFKPFWLGISYSKWGYMFFVAALLPIFYLLCKRKASLIAFLFAGCLVPFSAFLFLTKMHERYLQQALPFFLVLTLKKKSDPVYWLGFLLLSLIYFINLYHDWWAPGNEFLKSLFLQMPVINIITGIEISIFVLLYVRYIKDVT
jgi:hypothetical protein